ncbi:hypothetical protein SIN8267_03268 [Sinobacterium norvegicum]|uniref:NAD-dependent epimerase/dehydratase domain-containing protein n=1 Tax=Sinobacterium norvegicum TaxID=1641715 RepID=A0ABN8EP56_9GAMM|nr:NAD-dependent epimerase/dehydratase family protein [Sinobacterium norvegicum]CAH0993129.1 hypothetical protein SIN8267_03268 [Sinobacterium norvegicum]
MARVLLVGCGRLGLAVAKLLHKKDHSVTGLRRDISQLPDYITGISADITKPKTLQQLQLMTFEYIVVATTAGEFNDAAYRRTYVDGLANLLAAIAGPVKRLFLVSSTSVYHQCDGSVVDEQSATLPNHFSGCRQLEAETIANNGPIASTVVRFSGIYGPGRYRLIEQVLNHQGGSSELFTNRIHIDDCAAILVFLLSQCENKKSVDSVYIGTDSSPVTMAEIKNWLAVMLGVDKNDLIAAKDGARRSSKKISNNKLLALGYHFKYPDYKSGYGPVVKNWLDKNKK